MSVTVFLAVIFAALLHASWNALLKSGSDKRLGMGALILGHLPVAFLGLLYSGVPNWESWPYIVAGISMHMGYQLFLLHSYKIGDLSQVYPIARGSAPLIVTVISVTALGVTLNKWQLFAIAFIAAGLLSLGLMRKSMGSTNPKAAALALTTGGFIAGYSLIDGYGAREAGSALAYYCTLTFGNVLCMCIYLYATGKDSFSRIINEEKKTFWLGGSASFLAYALVTWAFTQAPIALVTALREISIIFALLIGVVFLKERLNLVKLISTFLTLLGVVLLRISKT